MHQFEAIVVRNRNIRGRYFHCVVRAPRIAAEARPGQFITVRLSDFSEPLLRRPFSIHTVSGPHIEVLYEVLGRGTEILAQKKPGAYIDVIGPLGNGFDLSAHDARHGVPLLVAGGMGVAPLVFLARRLSKGKTKSVQGKMVVLIGARTKEHILCEKEFKELGFDVTIATDDGSRGFRGKVTWLLERSLPTNQRTNQPTNQIYACGPKPMLKEISRIAGQRRLNAQISLEEHMACGIGACLGCVVKTTLGFKRVCKEGPVFKAEEVVWEQKGAR